MSDLVSGLTAPPAPPIPLASVSGNLGLQFSPPPGQVQAQAQPQPETGGDDVILRDAGGEYRVPRAEYTDLEARGYHHPGTVVQGGQAGPSPDAGNNIAGVQKAVRQEWLSAGYSPAAVDGIMRRVGAESRFNPHAIGDGGTSFGLYQHHADRASRLAQWAQQNGMNPADPIAQTRFAIAEMNGLDPKAAMAREALMRETDPNKAYGLFTSSFERPSGAPGSTETNLHSVAFGQFTGSAVPLIQNWQADLARRGKAYDEALAEAKDIRSAARAAIGHWATESDKPPQNMHEAWQQWSGIASAFALLGGLVGRNHTAALAAAGTMLQAANTADAAAYDKAYGQWKDHLDRGLKLVDLLNQDARNIVDDARKSYEDKVTELSTLSTAYQLHEKLDPQSVENIGKKLDIARKQRDLIEAQNDETKIRNATAAKDQSWLQAHPEAKGIVPADIQNQHTGDAKREHEGTSVSGQVMQFKMAQAAELEAQGVPHEEALRRVGLIPQLPKQAAGSEEAKFIESQVSTDRAAHQSKGEPYTADDEQASRLRAREDWSRSAAAGRVAAGRPETASDRALQWKMNRARELIGEGKSADEAYRMVGLEPQQRAAGLETQFIQGSVAQAEAEAESQGRPFTEADRNGAIAAAHQEWSRRTAAGRAEARPAVVPGGIEGQFVQGEISAAEAKAKESGQPFTQADRNTAMAAAAQEWERRKATGRVEAGRAVSATDQLKIDAYQGLLAGQKEQYRSAHDGKDPDGPELTKMQTSALRDAGIIRASATTGDLSPESVKMLAQLYTLGDTAVITSLPRGGQARIQVENEVAKQLEETGQGAGAIALNRLKMAEARAAATTAGRVTVLTEMFSQEAESAGREVVRTSKLFTRTNYPAVNQALEAFALQTGDPNIISFGQALSGFINAYGKLSNPTGVGVHDADKARVEKNLQERLSQGQIEAGVEQVITEGRIISNAAREAQIKVLAGLVPRTDGAAAPGAPPPPAASPPPAGGKPPIESFFR